MASIYSKNDRFYAKVKDAAGRWRDKALPKGIRKAEALRLAFELEGAAMAAPGQAHTPPPASMTVEGLMQWWLKHESPRTASHGPNTSYVKRHFMGTPFAAMALPDLTPGKVEAFLRNKEAEVSAATCNHIRMFLHRAIRAAQRAEVYGGANPIADVRRCKTPHRKPDFLKAHEVPRLLAALDPRWRPLFATAIYTGMRKGELLGLCKIDIELQAGFIHVRHSHGRDTTKTGKEDVVPIAQELIPFLQAAIGASRSKFVFPAEDGERMREDTKLEKVLRRALGRSGIVEEFEHVCRKKGCTHAVHAPDPALRHCPTHGMKLWPKAVVRKLRFHDLRHTCASLLVMAGADMAAVQRILRHSDPRMTTGVYTHLVPGYLKDQINKLHLLPSTPLQAVAPVATPFVVGLWPEPQLSHNASLGLPQNPAELLDFSSARNPGLEPGTFGFGGTVSNLA